MTSTERVVLVRGARKTYGDTVAVDHIDLEVRRGQIVAVLGPNGAGKTTLFELLLGLVRPDAGTLEVLGERPRPSTRLRVGTMMQSVGLPEHVQAAELVDLIGRAHPLRLTTAEALERTGLADRARRRVTDLSGGERQRLLLAMAIVGAPELLLLDEPTAAMDVAARRAFWRQTTQAATQGATVVFATHDLAEARAVADRVVVIARGRVLADATPDALTHEGRDDLEDVFLTLTEETSAAHPEGALR